MLSASTIVDCKPHNNIRRLILENLPLGNDEYIDYVMHAFPNLQDIHLRLRPRLANSAAFIPQTDCLFNQKAIQFLKYLANIPTVDVPFIFVENITSVLTDFYGDLRTFGVTYQPAHRNSGPCLKICSKGVTNGTRKPAVAEDDKSRLTLEVLYSASSENLPDMEIIKTAGENLKKLYLNMCDSIIRIRSEHQDNVWNESYMGDVFQNCLNLQQLDLINTFLMMYKPGLSMTQNLRGGKLRLVYAYIGPEYLPSLSLRCPQLDLLDFVKTSFVYHNGSRVNRPNNVTIAMRSTKFGRIKWHTVEG